MLTQLFKTVLYFTFIPEFSSQVFPISVLPCYCAGIRYISPEIIISIFFCLLTKGCRPRCIFYLATHLAICHINKHQIYLCIFSQAKIRRTYMYNRTGMAVVCLNTFITFLFTFNAYGTFQCCVQFFESFNYFSQLRADNSLEEYFSLPTLLIRYIIGGANDI